MFLVVVIAWLAAVYFAIEFAGACLAPDACLDTGGSFDYVHWTCAYEVSHPYVPVGFDQIPGFWAMSASAAAAVVLGACVLRTRLGANPVLQAQRSPAGSGQSATVRPRMTAQSHAQVTVHAPATVVALEVVDAGLGKFNAEASTIGDVRPLHVVASDASGATVGGAIGRTWGDCCELQQFWVTPAQRGQGIGSRLLEAFEGEARLRGCQLVCLDTFSFQAPSFYARRGYVEVLRVTGFTGNVVRITMHKRLPQQGSLA